MQIVKKWQPVPVEAASLTYLNYNAYLIGGINYNAVKDVAALSFKNIDSSNLDDILPCWKKINVKLNLLNESSNPQGVFGHSSCAYKDYIYSLGGAFMYDQKRQIREFSN